MSTYFKDAGRDKLSKLDEATRERMYNTIINPSIRLKARRHSHRSSHS